MLQRLPRLLDAHRLLPAGLLVAPLHGVVAAEHVELELHEDPLEAVSQGALYVVRKADGLQLNVLERNVEVDVSLHALPVLEVDLALLPDFEGVGGAQHLGLVQTLDQGRQSVVAHDLFHVQLLHPLLPAVEAFRFGVLYRLF